MRYYYIAVRNKKDYGYFAVEQDESYTAIILVPWLNNSWHRVTEPGPFSTFTQDDRFIIIPVSESMYNNVQERVL